MPYAVDYSSLYIIYMGEHRHYSRWDHGDALTSRQREQLVCIEGRLLKRFLINEALRTSLRGGSIMTTSRYMRPKDSEFEWPPDPFMAEGIAASIHRLMACAAVTVDISALW